MEASMFPTKTAVTYSKDEEDFPYTIDVEDEGGSTVRIHLDRYNFDRLQTAMLSAEMEKIHCELASAIARVKEDERGHRD